MEIMGPDFLIAILVIFAAFFVLLLVLTRLRRRAGGGLGATDHYDGSTTVTPTGYGAEPETDIDEVIGDGDPSDDSTD